MEVLRIIFLIICFVVEGLECFRAVASGKRFLAFLVAATVQLFQFFVELVTFAQV